MDPDGARRLNRSSPSCLNSGAQRTDFFHGLFSLRGLAKVRGEWDLVCLALNAKRLHALIAA